MVADGNSLAVVPVERDSLRGFHPFAAEDHCLAGEFRPRPPSGECPVCGATSGHSTTDLKFVFRLLPRSIERSSDAGRWQRCERLRQANSASTCCARPLASFGPLADLHKSLTRSLSC